MIAETRVTADILVIGGGIAGCFAAIKAKQTGVDVILVDKGYVGKSGQSAYATDFLAFSTDKGHDFDDWMQCINKSSEYVNNRYWTELTIRKSYETYRELLSWGMEFDAENESSLGLFPSMPKGMTKPLVYNPADLSKVLRNQVVKSGVKIFDRVMITELLKQDDRIVGASGISPDSDALSVFSATSTILCVGACGFKPAGFPPLIQLTCDGEAIAYRAGAELGGKEFVDTHFTRIDNLGIIKRRGLDDKLEALMGKETGGSFFDGQFNAHGDAVDIRPPGVSEYWFTYLLREFEAHEGRAPITQGSIHGAQVTGGAALGMSVRKADGLWPANEKCASSVPGLYAAGDSLYTIQNGSAYALLGSSMASSAITGSIAGIAAAEDARTFGALVVSEEEISRAKSLVYAPAQRKGGYSPRWVTQLLQNTMMPYFVSYIKKEDRLQAALSTIMFMGEHLVPRMFAANTHELRLAHEAKNMVLSAEMRLRSALFRTESRGTHYREDYPNRDDTNWLAWTKIVQECGVMKLTKVPIPKEWHPDASEPYEAKYPIRFPGETLP